jgi:hypothetical protein
MKAQIRIQEMSFMIVAVVIFFALVGLLAFSVLYSNLHEEATQITEDKTLSAITNLADTPEFTCGEPNCVDADKLMSLIGKESYKDFWDFSSLSVIKFSGFDKDEKDLIKCNLGNYPDCDIFEIYDKNINNEKKISSFVALCRKEYENDYTYNKCEVARLIAGSERK